MESEVRSKNPLPQAILQSNSDKKCMVLVQSQVHQLNRIEDPEIKPYMYWTHDLGLRTYKYRNINTEKRKYLQQMMLFELSVDMEKSENKSIFVSVHKAQVQVDEGLQHKTRYSESKRREFGKESRIH